MNKLKTARLNAAKARWAREDSQRPAYTVYRHGRPAYDKKPQKHPYAEDFVLVLVLFVVAIVCLVLSASQ